MKTLTQRAIMLFLFSILFTSCYTVRVNLGTTCQADINNEDSFWRDIAFTETVVKLKPAQTPEMTVPCPGKCVCKMEYRVGFGNVLVSAITLGFVRRVKVRYACCQPTNH